ncbi:outer membrane beta-barrel protein [Bartonella krasnovii]|uniref:Outer membrane beta-barrel protein n=1 Tax=Bartonella krasnovii TaxID=2267275 RepID=A0A5B9CZQ3_9HYPH|nr:outer membrane beta-barrel protein [Bartonella krasnovii]QEE11585.1 outer membrane beta-barrel protein [Bartonella krasnovii]UNF53912.1 outer membrane beta-barrel protein [Bartonella krasnovii]
MNTKRLITASIFSLISASTALAADVLIPHQTAPSTPSSTIVAPTFSWTGLYLGVQAGGFSSKSDMALVDQEKGFPLDKEFSPKLSGFAGGFYAGSNIDLGDSFIFGIDTDLMISGKKHTKTINIGTDDNVTVEKSVGRFRKSAAAKTSSQTTGTQTQGTTGVALNPLVPEKTTSASGTSPASAAGSPAAGARAPSSQTVETSSPGNVNSTIQGKTVTVGGEPGVSTASLKTQSASPTMQSGSAKQVMRTVPSSSASSARTDARQSSVTVGETGSSLAASKPTPALTGTGAGSQTSGVAASSVSPTKSETSQTVVKSPTSGQPSLAERTVPAGPLTLARSGSSNGSETKASNGTSGTQHGGHHSAHGSGHSNPHGASHPGGHGSGANPHGSHGANPHASRPHGAQSVQAADKSDSSVYGIEQMKKMASELGLEQGDEVETLNHTFKQNWGGATRVRIGFAADRFMPYLAGGIAYGQFQDTVSVSVKGEDGTVVSSRNLTDETKTMIGYTLGGGVDFSVLDNVIVRAEYRYSDFGKKKLAKEKLEINYKTNDFRVGVAYKF